MHLVDDSQSAPVRSVDELVAYFTDAGKPRASWRVGTEHELIGVRTRGAVGAAPPYEGDAGIGALLDAFARAGGRAWTPVLEGEHVIALSRGDEQITIEPGGQFELAGRPVAHTAEFAQDLHRYIGELGALSDRLGIAWLRSGFRPFGRIDDVPWMPKRRYGVMRAYMPGVGTRGLEMMLRTATVQTNLDFSDGDDAAAKLRAIMSVTSILTAIWASSPIVDGQVSGFQSYRAWIWRDTDNARAGLLPFAFEGGDVLRAYVEWALDVPMYFVYRGGYVPARGLTFRKFLRDGFEGPAGKTTATESDWALHLSTLFPDARLKKFLEVRGCDCGSLGMILALGPFTRGLLYDETARAAATALTAGMTLAERNALADEVPRAGLAATAGLRGRTVGQLARELVEIVADGLRREAPEEVGYLDPVREIVESGRTQADATIELWKRTGGEPARVIAELAHPGLGGGLRAA